MSLINLSDSEVFHIASIFFNWKYICATNHSKILYENGHPIMNIQRYEGNRERIVLRDHYGRILMFIYSHRITIRKESQESSHWKELFRFLNMRGYEL